MRIRRKFRPSFGFIPLCLLTLITATAQQSATAHEGGPHIRGVISSGLTFGGDEIDEFVVETEFFGDTDRDTEDISAGELFFFSGGAIVEIENFQLQGTIGYYGDSVDADNGDASFTRWPLEFLGFYRLHQMRFGGGLTYHLNPEYDYELTNISDEEIEFKNALGVVLQADYFFKPFAQVGVEVGVGARVTLIEYEVESASSRFESRVGRKLDGDSVGIALTLLF